VLLADAKRHTARGEDAQAWDGCDQPGDERKGVGEVLEVVEHQQPDLAQRRDHVLEQRPAGRFLDAEGLSDGREHEVGVSEWREIDRDATAEPGGGGLGQARLADPARAGERHQPDVASPQERGDGRELELPADETVAPGPRRRDARHEGRVVLEDATFERAQRG
jgi:hypothetical protein